MRISDWSSDVCSSDLTAVERRGARPIGPTSAAGRAVPLRIAVALHRHRPRRPGPPGGVRDDPARAGLEAVGHPAAAARRKSVTGVRLQERLEPFPQNPHPCQGFDTPCGTRSEEHTSELQSLMSTSYAVFCLKKKIPRAERKDY